MSKVVLVRENAHGESGGFERLLDSALKITINTPRNIWSEWGVAAANLHRLLRDAIDERNLRELNLGTDERDRIKQLIANALTCTGRISTKDNGNKFKHVRRLAVRALCVRDRAEARAKEEKLAYSNYRLMF